MKSRKPLTQDELFALKRGFESETSHQAAAIAFDVTPQTARRFYKLFRDGWDGVRVVHDPKQNLRIWSATKAIPEPAKTIRPTPHAMPWCTYERLTGRRA